MRRRHFCAADRGRQALHFRAQRNANRDECFSINSNVTYMKVVGKVGSVIGKLQVIYAANGPDMWASFSLSYSHGVVITHTLSYCPNMKELRTMYESINNQNHPKRINKK
jgi:hypothetical protein